MLAGNHALPMVLRLIIWIGTKIFKSGPTNETLHFLLDHPRRSVHPFVELVCFMSVLTINEQMFPLSLSKPSNMVSDLDIPCVHVRLDCASIVVSTRD